MSEETERPCIDCGDETLNSHGRCRDCDIKYMLDDMQCSACKNMRYTRDEKLAPMAASLWGVRCECAEPRPPSVHEAKRATPPNNEQREVKSE